MVDFQIATPSDVLQGILDRLSHHDMGDGQYDGDRATRLVDASYALHMAVIALNGVDLDQVPVSCETAGKSGTKRGVSPVDIEHIGDEIDSTIIHPIFKTTLAMQSVLQHIDDPEIHGCIEGAIQDLDDVIRHARRFIFDLSEPVD